MAKNCDIQRRNLSLVDFLHIKVSAPRARPLSYHNLNNENDNLKRTTNARLQKLHGGDFNTNGNLNFTKLVMHGYKLLNAILTEMKT